MPQTNAGLRLTTCGLLSVLLAPALASAADTNTWMGAPDQVGAFNDPTLWSLGTVPDGTTSNIAIGAGGVLEDASFTNRVALRLGTPASLVLAPGTVLTNAAGAFVEFDGRIVGSGALFNASDDPLHGPGIVVNSTSAVLGVNLTQTAFGSIGTEPTGVLTLDGITVTGGLIREGNYLALGNTVLRDVRLGADPSERVVIGTGSTVNLQGTDVVRGQLLLQDGTRLTGAGLVNAGAGGDVSSVVGIGNAVIATNVTQIGNASIGGSIVLDGGRITGGEFLSGQLAAANGAALQDVTFALDSHHPQTEIVGGSALTLLGTITNRTRLVIDDGVRFSGPGTLNNVGSTSFDPDIQLAGRFVLASNMTQAPGATIGGGELVLDGVRVTGGVLLSGNLTAQNGASVQDVTFGEGLHAQRVQLTSGSNLDLLGTNSIDGGLIMQGDSRIAGTGTLLNRSGANDPRYGVVADGGRAVIGVDVTQTTGSTMQAINGGTLVIDGATVTGGIITHADLEALNGASVRDVRLGANNRDHLVLTSASALTANGQVFNGLELLDQRGALTVTAGSAMTNGGGSGTTWQVSGTLRNEGTIANVGSILESAGGGTVLNAGTLANLIGGALVVRDGGTFINTGTVTTDYQSSFGVQAGGRAENAGTMTLAGNTIGIAGALKNNGVITAVAGPLIGDPPIATPAPPMNIAASGLLSGTGRIQASVVNAGTLAPGDDVGTCTIEGNYTQTLGGILDIYLGGSGVGQYGVLDVSALASLGGTLAFIAQAGFAPQIGDVFEFMLFGARSGDFTNVQFTNWSCPIGATCEEVRGDHSFALLIGKGEPMPVPEPGMLSLFAIGLGGLGLMQSARTRRAARVGA